MKSRKILAILLAAALIAAVLSGCGENSNWFLDDDPEVVNGQLPNDPASPNTPPLPPELGGFIHIQDVDFDAAFDAFPPDTVMLVVGEFTVTWEELFFNIRGTLNELASALNGFIGLSETMPDGATYAEVVLDYAVNNALMFITFEFGATRNGITANDIDRDVLAFDLENMVAMFGGEEDFARILWEHDGIRNVSLLERLMTLNYMTSATFDLLYGVEGSLLSDEDAAMLTANDGFLMAKHILRLKTTDGDETPRIEIDGIYSRLLAYDGDDFASFFDELMIEHSEDGGLIYYPHGYLFQNGDMVTEFYDACMSLEIGGFSEPVETQYGYHILLRLPINYDVMPSSGGMMNDFRTLRHIAAMEMFDFDMLGWSFQLDPVFTPAFESLDLAAIFVERT